VVCKPIQAGAIPARIPAFAICTSAGEGCPVEKANEGRAVADIAVKPNFTVSMQRLIERQCVSEPSAIISHACSVKLQARITAKRVATDLTPALSAGKGRSGAIAEIESRTNVGTDVRVAIIPFVPTRV